MSPPWLRLAISWNGARSRSTWSSRPPRRCRYCAMKLGTHAVAKIAPTSSSRSSSPRRRNTPSPPDLAAHALDQFLRVVRDAVLEHQFDSGELAEVLVGLSIHQYEVGLLALGDGPAAVLDAEVGRPVQGRHVDRLERREARLAQQPDRRVVASPRQRSPPACRIRASLQVTARRDEGALESLLLLEELQ